MSHAAPPPPISSELDPGAVRGPVAPPALPAEVVYLSATSGGSQQHFVLGRSGTGGDFLRVPQSPVDSARNYMSGRHAEVVVDPSGMVAIRDLNSTNGTSITRDDPVTRTCRTISVGTSDFVFLQHGDHVRLGTAVYRFYNDGGAPRLYRSAGYAGSVPAGGMRITPLRYAMERPLLERMDEARRAGEAVEIFLRGSKEKHAVVVQRIEPSSAGPVAVVRDGNGGIQRFALNDIITVRGRGSADDRTASYSRVANPQFRDRSVNQSGLTGKMVLVDFTDGRLTGFLETYMGPIRDALAAGRMTQRQAAEAAWRVIHDYVPYDRGRFDGVQVQQELPNELYRLGDFIERGVCNERGMLLQVSLQYVGIESRMEKGPSPFPDSPGYRHAWVRATFPEERGRTAEIILDPQVSRPYVVGVDAEAANFRSDAVRFVQPAVATRMLDAPLIALAARDLRVLAPDNPVTLENIEAELRDRYPPFANERYNPILQAVAQEILEAWERDGRPPQEAGALPGLVPERYVERGMESMYEGMQRRRQLDHMDRFLLEDRGGRSRRGTDRLERDLIDIFNESARRARDIGLRR